MTDAMIDKLQNYFGIAIRSNFGNFEGMKKAVLIVPPMRHTHFMITAHQGLTVGVDISTIPQLINMLLGYLLMLF